MLCECERCRRRLVSVAARVTGSVPCQSRSGVLQHTKVVKVLQVAGIQAVELISNFDVFESHMSRSPSAVAVINRHARRQACFSHRWCSNAQEPAAL